MKNLWSRELQKTMEKANPGKEVANQTQKQLTKDLGSKDW